MTTILITIESSILQHSFFIISVYFNRIPSTTWTTVFICALVPFSNQLIYTDLLKKMCPQTKFSYNLRLSKITAPQIFAGRQLIVPYIYFIYDLKIAR